ncbi:MAG TPA: DUF167 domain-containing protein [Candidatus Saccharimonadales bacterium]|nr:DUF167 domain-containing protein [Candidatus Saccharimonadales bacterium]
MSFLDISEDLARGTVSFVVRVQPRAGRDAVAGTLGGALKIRLSAPPVDGRANEALIEFLSSILKTSKSAVRIRSGEQSRSKRVEIFGVTRQQIEGLLQAEA